MFCEIASGAAPAFVVDEDDDAIAFLDRAPAADGHTLVIPKRHVSGILDVADDDLASVARLARRVARNLHERLRPDGIFLSQATGEAAWQDVLHLHVHVIPRWHGDALVPPWTAVPAERDVLRQLHLQLTREPG